MTTSIHDEGFASVAFADLDTLTDRELHDLNNELSTRGSDAARVEQWRSRIADILVRRI